MGSFLALNRAMEDPRRELPRQITKLQADIREQKAEILRTKDDVKKTMAEVQKAQVATGWFAKSTLKAVTLLLEQQQGLLRDQQQELLELEADHRELSTPSFPPGKTWTFAEVEATIEKLNRTVITLCDTMQNTAAVGAAGADSGTWRADCAWPNII